MGWVTYLGFLAIMLVVAIAVEWYQPSVVDQLARKTGLSGRKGWTVLVLAAAWVFLPVLAGATAEGDDLWMFGSAVAGVGFYLGTVAVASVDEYRLLDRTPHVPPDRVTVGSGGEALATSGVPSVDAEEEARPERCSRGRPQFTRTGSSSAASGSGHAGSGGGSPGACGASGSPSATARSR